MIDPVIDEHFRRSLGADYLTLFGGGNKGNKSSYSTNSRTSITTTNGVSLAVPPTQTWPPPKSSSPAPLVLTVTAAESKTEIPIVDNISRVSEIEEAIEQQPVDSDNGNTSDNSSEVVSMSVDDHFAKALGGETWKQLQRSDSKSDNCQARKN